MALAFIFESGVHVVVAAVTVAVAVVVAADADDHVDAAVEAVVIVAVVADRYYTCPCSLMEWTERAFVNVNEENRQANFLQ